MNDPLTDVEDEAATPLTPQERHDLIPSYITTRDQLNEVEQFGIAEADPATLADLGRCRGMGPIRLERWGDEILGVLEQAREIPSA